MSNEKQKTHAITWTYRQPMAEQWPTPPPPDAYRFSGTEAAESLDAVQAGLFEETE